MRQRQHHDHGHQAEIDPATITAGLLYPWFGILLSPIIASAAMAFSSVAVVGNYLRLNRVML